MANTYSQLQVHFVWAVKFRNAQLNSKWRADLFKYMTVIVQNRGQKLLQVNGVEDHIHMLVGMRPDLAPSDLMKVVKGESSKWINSKKIVVGNFRWQEGFACFSVCRDSYPNVVNYIKNQEEHHKKKSFKEEYQEMLTRAEIPFDERYMFSPLE